MQTSLFLHRHFKLNLAALACSLVLAIGFLLVWTASLERETTSLGVGLRLAALGLVVLWTHLLTWLFRKMSQREISAGYCVILFFGAWAVFFLVYNCLL
jgi:hypothetical protein